MFNPRAYANQNRLLTELRRFGIPVINEEPGYEMQGRTGAWHRIDPRSYNSQTSERLLTTFWTATLAGAYSMWGSNETYCMEDPLPGLQNSATPQYIKVLHDFMASLPYWEMEPDNDAVSPFEIKVDGIAWRTNFCCSKKDEIYLVFSTYGDKLEINLGGRGRYQVKRLNPRTGREDDLGLVDGGIRELNLPKGEWVLLSKRVP